MLTPSRVRLCDPMDYGLPGSSVPGMLQAGTLERVAASSSRGSFCPRDQTCVSVAPALQADSLPAEPLGKPLDTMSTVFRLGINALKFH